jgi:hypothetical protein
MPTNPFHHAQLSVLQLRVPTDALNSTLTRTMEHLVTVQGDHRHPVSRPEFGRYLRESRERIAQFLEHVARDGQPCLDDIDQLLAQVESGANLTAYDVTVPWERRQARARE